MFRRAFTLVEMTMASGIFAIVVGGVVGLFIGVQRMTKTSFAEAELSVRMRELREKVLFHAAPPHDNRSWSGILSGTRLDGGAVVEGETKIYMNTAWGYDLGTDCAVAQKIELVPSDLALDDGETVRAFVNDGDREDERWETRWLDPGRLSWLPETSDEIGVFDTAYLAKGVFYVNLKATAGGVTRRERVVVPVFGKQQRTLTAGKVFDD